MKKLFRDFEENCGWKSIVKFVEFVDNYHRRKDLKAVNVALESFNNLSDFGCIKNYANFKRYCLQLDRLAK